MGSSFLDLITPSDGAFTAVNIHSNLKVWNQALEILRLDPKEQAKYKPKNRKRLPHDERANYMLKQSKFTKKKGRRAAYTNHQYTKEGMQSYEAMKGGWEALFRDQVRFEKLEVVWERGVE